LLICLAGVSGCSRTGPMLTTGEQQFQSVIGVRLDPEFKLVTDAAQYKVSDLVAYQPSNKTDKTIFFQDQTFGLRAYKYDPVSKQWMGLGNPSRLIGGQPISVPPYDLPNTFFAEGIYTGALRLVVIGWTDPSNPEGSRIAAYTDIVVGN
jgi:hypothetical protein